MRFMFLYGGFQPGQTWQWLRSLVSVNPQQLSQAIQILILDLRRGSSGCQQRPYQDAFAGLARDNNRNVFEPLMLRDQKENNLCRRLDASWINCLEAVNQAMSERLDLAEQFQGLGGCPGPVMRALQTKAAVGADRSVSGEGIRA